MSRLFKTPSPSADRASCVADVQTFATSGADIFMFDTYARVICRRGMNTGAVAAPVFSVPDRRLDAAILDGFWRWTFRNSKGPSRIAPTNTNTAHTASTLSFDLVSTRRTSIRVVLAGRASRTPQTAKANLLLRCRRICCGNTLA